MKNFLFATAAFFVIQIPAFAGQPFRYTAKCYVVNVEDQCVIVETREKGGALKSRNIFSNKAGLTIKMWWDSKQNKFVQTDSFNKFEYNWEYKANPEIKDGDIVATEVIPKVYVLGISWD